jgi:ribosomal protein L37AE/L43A
MTLRKDDMEKTELKPCPICGSKAEFKIAFTDVCCTGCGLSIHGSPIFHEYSGDYMEEETFNKAADLWNRRTQ